MKKHLLVLLCLAVASIGTTAEARRKGNCGPCKTACNPCGPKDCDNQCDVEVTCPQGTCINPPGKPCFESCVKKECTVEQVPVQFYRNVKRCNVEVPGPVYATCPGTDRMVAPAETDMEVAADRMTDVPDMKMSRRQRRAMRRNAQ